MQYYVEYNYPKWGDSGGFQYSDDYYKYKHTVIKAQSIDELRVKIIRDLAKGRPFRSYVYKLGMSGVPNYDALLGQLYHYPDYYVWFIRNTKGGWVVCPRTGKKMER